MRQALSYVWSSPWVKAVVLVAGVPLALLAIWEILSFTPSAWVPALAAFIFAYLANPMVVWLERHRVRRGFGVVLVYLLFLVLLALVSYLLAGVLAQLVELAGDLPDLVAASANWVQETISRFRETVPPSFASTLDQVEETISSFFSNLADVLVNWLQSLVGSGGTLLQAASNVVGGVFQFFLSIILSIYLLVDYPRLAKSVQRAVPVQFRPSVFAITSRLDSAVGGYVRGQIAIAATVGVLVFIGLSILGVPQAGALGFIAGLFNLVPYLGAVISVIPAVLMALVGDDGSLLKALITIGIFLGVNQIEAQLLSPLILSRATSLHPITIILAIVAAGSVFGLWGALAAVPLTAFLKVLYEDYYLGSQIHGGEKPKKRPPPNFRRQPKAKPGPKEAEPPAPDQPKP